MSVRVFAPAKINLTLKVGRPRPDGYHPLESVVMFADIGDIVEAEESDLSSLLIHGPFADDLDAGEGNLVLRAARALAVAAGVKAGARLSLEKNLPIASGIGGGSSDAAAALRALNDLWGLKWSTAQLADIGRGLGADVAVFFTGAGAAYMSGIGDTCTPIRAPALHAVLVNPLRPLSTHDVYLRFDTMGLGSALSGASTPAWETQERALATMRTLGNDLEGAARMLAPEIDLILSELRAGSGVLHAALSGSGATVFAILNDEQTAEALTDDLISRHPDWWVQDAMLGA